MTTIATTSQPATSSSLKRLISRHPLIAYFVIAFAGTWVPLLPFALSRGVNGLGLLPYRLPDSTFYIAFVLAAFAGPALASLTVTAIISGRAGVAEELGWRGFALPRLQQRYGPVLGTVILGSLHGLWHLPVFFTQVLGPFSLPNYAGFLFVAIAAAFLYTWIFNHTRGSVLLATLTHGFGDAASGLVGLLIPAQLVISGWAQPFVNGNWQGMNVMIFGVCALLLLLFTRGRLGYQPERNAQLIEAPRPAAMPLAQV